MIAQFLMDNIPDFFWGLGAFALFVLLVLKFGLKPVVAAIDARERKIADDLARSAENAERASRIRADLETQMKGAEAHIAELIAAAKREAESQKAAILAEGRAELEAARHRSLREIERVRHEALVSMRQELADIATLAASRILEKECDAQVHRDLVLKVIERIEADTTAARSLALGGAGA